MNFLIPSVIPGSNEPNAAGSDSCAKEANGKLRKSYAGSVQSGEQSSVENDAFLAYTGILVPSGADQTCGTAWD